MAESAFLKAREEREATRQARALAGPSEDAQHRTELVHELERLSASIKHQVEEVRDYDNALSTWRALQERITSSADTKTLPPHEMKSWNKTLNDWSVAIEALRSSTKGVAKKKAFAFSKKPSTTVPQPTPVASPLTEGVLRTSMASALASADTAAAHSPALPPGGAVYSDLKGQVVFVAPQKAVFVRRCVDCVFLAAPTAGSFFLSDCQGTTAYVCCHQMRIRSCTDMTVMVWCSSTPVIESCTGMVFGPYATWVGLCASSVTGIDGQVHAYKTPTEWAEIVGEQRDMVHATNAWRTVDDFHWLKQAQSPNWRAISADEEASYITARVYEEPQSPPTKEDGEAGRTQQVPVE